MVCIFQHPALLTHDRLSVDHYLTHGVCKKSLIWAKAGSGPAPAAFSSKRTSVGLLFAVNGNSEVTYVKSADRKINPH